MSKKELNYASLCFTDENDHVLAELKVRKDFIKAELQKGDSVCRVGIVMDCMSRMWDAMDENNVEKLAGNANDFILSLFCTEDGEFPESVSCVCENQHKCSEHGSEHSRCPGHYN